MAKVARAARVASRQRVEAITADKTIGSAETGELYLVDQSAGSVTITLPSRQDGAYFKFIISDELSALDSKKITIQSNASDVSNGEVVGSSITLLDGANPAHGTHQSAAKSDAHYQFIIEAGASGQKLFAGSHVEVYCDGTTWYVSAVLRTSNAAVIGKFHGS